MEAPIARFATRDTRHDRATGRAADSRRGRAEARRSQEELWANCIADQPQLISDIADFIARARTRLIESPPVAPDDDPKSQIKSEGPARTRRK